MKSVEDLIIELPELIYCKNRKKKAFLEITKNHVYYCTKHDTQGNLSCVFVSIKGSLRENLEDATKWVFENLEKKEIEIV